MKKYFSLGELLADYRAYNNISQTQFSANINVDVRTVQRWEKDITLIKPDKEEEIVLETLLPYQLIRNLNASVPIPTYYDFSLRKYSLTERTNSLPSAKRFKEQLGIATKRTRSIDFKSDVNHIIKALELEKNNSNLISRDVIKEAIRLLPEANLVITDDSGYFSGFCLVLPIKYEVYQKLESREISKEEIAVEDLVNYNTLERPVFFGFDFTADCNDNIYYLVNRALRFLKSISNKDYLYCSTPHRHDSYEINIDAGLKLIWKDESSPNSHLRFYKGNFTKFLVEE